MDKSHRNALPSDIILIFIVSMCVKHIFLCYELRKKKQKIVCYVWRFIEPKRRIPFHAMHAACRQFSYTNSSEMPTRLCADQNARKTMAMPPLIEQ